MTHYLVLTTMPPENYKYMLHTLKQSAFRNDLNFCKKHDLCTCSPFSHANVREIKLMEIDVPTPATKDFETWLSEWGFSSVIRRLHPTVEGTILSEKDKKRKFLHHDQIKFSWLFRLLFKILYSLVSKIMLRGLPNYLKDLKNYSYIYRPFSPMEKRFAGELPDKYKVKMQYNQRNIVFGKVIEHPVGSYTKIKCKKCGAGHVSRH